MLCDDPCTLKSLSTCIYFIIQSYKKYVLLVDCPSEWPFPFTHRENGLPLPSVHRETGLVFSHFFLSTEKSGYYFLLSIEKLGYLFPLSIEKLGYFFLLPTGKPGYCQKAILMQHLKSIPSEKKYPP